MRSAHDPPLPGQNPLVVTIRPPNLLPRDHKPQAGECSPSEAPGSCRGCLLYSTRTANTPGLLLLLATAGGLLLLLLPVPMLFLGLSVGGFNSHSSNTRLLMYGGQWSMSAPKATAVHAQHSQQERVKRQLTLLADSCRLSATGTPPPSRLLSP